MRLFLLILALLLTPLCPALSETDSISRLLYVYVPACESCAEVKGILEALPESVEVQGEGGACTSALSIESLDASKESERVTSLFDTFNVPDDDRITPIVFYGSSYLAGVKPIRNRLAEEIAAGNAVGGLTADLVSSPETPESSASPEAFSLSGTAALGLVAGFNTCALSMLLLFLSVVLQSGRRAWLYAFAFLAAKFITYLAIGTLLLGVLQKFNPHWMQPLAKILLTVLGGILIVLNLSDAYHAHFADYGKIRNQLPASLRGGLRNAIQKRLSGKLLLPAAVVLGIIVAAGEFLCAGQLYLMRLLTALQSGMSDMALQLPVYCLAFIAPAAVITALILCGRSRLRIADALAERMDIIKLATAVVTIALILAAWLL